MNISLNAVTSSNSPHSGGLGGEVAVTFSAILAQLGHLVTLRKLQQMVTHCNCYSNTITAVVHLYPSSSHRQSDPFVFAKSLTLEFVCGSHFTLASHVAFNGAPPSKNTNSAPDKRQTRNTFAFRSGWTHSVPAKKLSNGWRLTRKPHGFWNPISDTQSNPSCLLLHVFRKIANSRRTCSPNERVKLGHGEVCFSSRRSSPRSKISSVLST